ncbi:hypothetical protein ACVWXS_004295 [Lysinibacillus sp. TE18511]
MTSIHNLGLSFRRSRLSIRRFDLSIRRSDFYP